MLLGNLEVITSLHNSSINMTNILQTKISHGSSHIADIIKTSMWHNLLTYYKVYKRCISETRALTFRINYNTLKGKL